MTTRRLATAIIAVVLVAACAEKPPATPEPQARSAAPPAPAALPPHETIVPPLTLEGYKKVFAQQVARGSPEVFTEAIPEMLKSVVVLEVTIASDGRLMHVAVRRSNGYRALENLAMDSVRRAAPYPAPAWTVRRRDGTVNFLETFLFRDDGRYQIRSLVASL